jgi:hypothetical protein
MDDKRASRMSYNVQQRVDAIASGECSPGAFVREVSVVCDATPDAAWDVLSLVDQYYRRGKLPADLFDTVRCGIERHALGVPDSDTAGIELCDAPVAAAAAAEVLRDVAPPMRERAAIPSDLASDTQELRIELLDASRRVQRYRRRLAFLAEFAHRTRSALADAQRDLQASRTEAMDYAERLKSREWHRSAREQITGEFTDTAATRDRMRIWRPVQTPQVLALAAVVLGVGASPTLQDLQTHRIAERIALPSAAAAPLPQISGPGQVSLSSDRYVVLPGQASAEIHVQRTAGASGDVSFVWWTQGSGARPGGDYVSGGPRMAHVPDGAGGLSFSVPILANPARKHTELFYVVIGKPGGGASLGSIRRATVFIMRPPSDPHDFEQHGCDSPGCYRRRF